MPSIQFSEQNVFSQGDQVTALYKLTQGSVTLLNQDAVIAQIHAPYYLNLFEYIFEIPALKTVRVNDICLVQKIRKPRENHKEILRIWKDQGFRKSKFLIFQQLQNALFYELLRFGTSLQIHKRSFLLTQQNQIYLVAAGTVHVSGLHSSLHYLSLSEGEIVVSPNPHTHIHAVTQGVRIMSIPISISKCLLGAQFKIIEDFMRQQKSAMDVFETRNNRLSHKLKKNSESSLSKTKIPIEFVNKIEEKVKNFQRYCGIKSSMGRFASKSKSSVLAENQERFKQLVELNRKKYGQQYIFNKRMEVGHKIASQSCSLSPTHHLYDPSTLKQPYAILFSHPLVKQWKQSRSRKAVLKKVGREGREKAPHFECRGLQTNLTFSN